MRLLIIDLSNSVEIKILNTNIKKSLHIISAYYISAPEEHDPIIAIGKKLLEEKLNNIPAIIIPPRSIMNYHTFTFPVIPEKEIRKILPREIQKYTDSQAEIVFDFQLGSKIIEKNEKKLEVIAYHITKKELWAILERLKKTGIQAIKIIPEVQSIESFIEKDFISQPISKANGIVVIDMMDSKINMNIFNKNVWSLNREFPFKLDSDKEITERDFSRISTEFSRTFQYFKQKNKNISLDEAIIYGSNHDITVLNDFINSNQPLNSTLINKIETNSKIIYPQNLKDKDEFISMFFVSIMTGNAIIRKDFIDLFPKEFTDKEKFPRQIMVYGLIGLLIFIGLAVISSFFQKQKNNYKKDLNKIQSEFNILQTQIDNILEVRKKRKEYYEKQIILEMPKKGSFQIADFIRELSVMFTDGYLIEISKLEIIPKEGKLSFSITGKLFSDNINESLKTFGLILNSIKKLQRIKIITFTPPSSANVRREKNDLSWNFLITGERELLME